VVSNDGEGIEGIYGGHFLHGNEEVAQHESLLGKIRGVLLLQCGFWLIHTKTVFGIVEVFACYRPGNIC
jgi:hypothetical protein